MEEKEKFFGCWYFYIHDKLKEKARGDKLNYKDARDFLFEWRIPKFMRPVILRELELIGLIERIDKKTILLKKSEIKMDNPSRLFDMVGLLP